MQTEVNRLLAKFVKGKDIFAGEIDVSHVQFKWLKDLFNPPEDDPLMYNSYRLDQRHAASLQQYISESIDLDQYEYYLDAEAK